MRGVPRFKRTDYWDEELFAPDVAVYVVKDEDEMVALHNASRFGLAASVFSADEASFHRLRERLEAGVVHWNRSTAMTPGRLPFGGLKASGNHRPAGIDVADHCVVPVGSVENGT
jgi:succinylglutamic semialdehyde dehydrogenase